MGALLEALGHCGGPCPAPLQECWCCAGLGSSSCLQLRALAAAAVRLMSGMWGWRGCGKVEKCIWSPLEVLGTGCRHGEVGQGLGSPAQGAPNPPAACRQCLEVLSRGKELRGRPPWGGHRWSALLRGGQGRRWQSQQEVAASAGACWCPHLHRNWRRGVGGCGQGFWGSLMELLASGSSCLPVALWHHWAAGGAQVCPRSVPARPRLRSPSAWVLLPDRCWAPGCWHHPSAPLERGSGHH